MNTQKLAACIANSRKKMGMTQRELAEQLGVTAKAVSKWETGVNIPDVALLSSIIKTLGISMQDLLEEESSPGRTFVSSLSLFPDTKETTIMNTKHISEAIPIDTNETFDLSPYIFGHNLEHTRSCIYGGLSAQMLRNRKFAGKPSKNEGCPMEWFLIGGTNVFSLLYEGYCPQVYENVKIYVKHETKNKMFRVNEQQSVGIQNLTGKAPCGIGQNGLAVSADKHYEFRLTACCEYATTLCVRLTDAKQEQVYAEQIIAIESGGWHISEFLLTPDRTDSNAILSITFPDINRVTFGALSMLPEGHFLGMRRDVIEHLKELGVSILRWPGGNFAGEYRWQDGLLPVDMRAPLQAAMEQETQPFSLGYDNHEIGTDEFVALCREVGAEPFITINAVWNTPEENANWVEYCNGSEDTPFGRLRAERGHKEPYQVKFWSLGNEMGFGHMEGPRTPEQYTALARQQANAMLAVTPDLKLFTSGPHPNPMWVEKAAKPLSAVAPYVSLHHYLRVHRNFTSPEAIRKTCEQIFAGPKEAYDLIHKMRDLLGDGIPISFDEWNCWYAWNRSSCVADGVFAAEMLHMLMQESIVSDVPICCYFQPIGEGAILVRPNDSCLTAIGQTFSFLKDHRGGKLCPAGNTDNFEMAATRKDDILTITMVNTDLYEAKPVAFDIANAQAADTPATNNPVAVSLLEAKVLAAESVLPHTYFTETDLDAVIEANLLRTEIPPHSIAKFRVKL